MSMFTEEQFNEYKGDQEFLEVRYYTNWPEEDTVEKHYSYEDYVNFFNDFFFFKILKEKINEL